MLQATKFPLEEHEAPYKDQIRAQLQYEGSRQFALQVKSIELIRLNCSPFHFY